uniref:Uncharacterized protein n=1 Tax=Hyaloperonospora arabidopsidis (strain Emoy2) TaxID=559515 RepID=M4B342_HYAAE
MIALSMTPAATSLVALKESEKLQNFCCNMSSLHPTSATMKYDARTTFRRLSTLGRLHGHVRLCF